MLAEAGIILDACNGSSNAAGNASIGLSKGGCEIIPTERIALTACLGKYCITLSAVNISTSFGVVTV